MRPHVASYTVSRLGFRIDVDSFICGPALAFQANLPDAYHVHAHHEARSGKTTAAYLVGYVALGFLRPHRRQLLSKFRRNGHLSSQSFHPVPGSCK